MDRDTFFNHLRQSGLLSGQAIAEAAAGFPQTAPGPAIARVLVAEGLLTRFQAKKLLAGRPNGLRLGRYRILDQLGQGVTGPVFKAVHRSMGRVVAIKVVHPRLLKDSLALDLFTREVRAAAQLHHPGIVTAYDAGVTRGRHFLVMEYVDGPSLQNLVPTHGPLSIDLACELMRQVALALQYAHEKGMVHRDIKPANLLLAHPPAAQGALPHASCPPQSSSTAPTAVVKVIDFGLARLHHAGRAGVEGTIKVEPGTVWGTVDYMAPEQAENFHAADIRSDLYSLGCTFYYLLAGQVPFPGGSDMEKLIKHHLHEAPLVTALRPEVPAPVAAIIRRLMAKERARRFQTPAELAQELAGLCDTSGGGAVAAARQDDHSLKPRALGTKESESKPVIDPPADMPSTVEELLDSAESTARIDATLLENWRQWIAVVEAFAHGRGGRHRAKPQMFLLLRKRLLEGCEAQAGSAEGVRREFFQKLAELVKPWLNPEALVRTDREILASLLRHCQQAEKGLKEHITRNQATEAGQTVLGGILSLFNRWRE